MPYSTVVEVRNALSPGDFTDSDAPYDNGDLTNTAADLSNDQLTDAIAEADSLIDSFIGGRYTTPVLLDFNGNVYVTTPHPLDYWSRNVAAYNATLTYRKSQDFADTDPVARRYIATMLAITAVRDGKATLNIPDNVSATGSQVGAGPIFNQYQGTLWSLCDFDLAPPVAPGPYWWYSQ